jgi:hypothetical protein
MSARPPEYNFQRYLAAKRTVDDRALNARVWEALHAAILPRATSRPLTLIEIGGGIGTMIERFLDEGRLPPTSYHMLDEQPDNIALAYTRLQSRQEYSTSHKEHEPLFPIRAKEAIAMRQKKGNIVEVSLYPVDLYDFLATAGSLSRVDLILAHAFMDLLDIPATLPQLTATLRPGTLLYFTINFDGATILEPAIDSHFDRFVEELYHRTMDERIINGKRSGDSHTGRHLFHQMKTAGIHTLDAGSSDWVVIPYQGAYPADEGYFLHFIINTMDGALKHHPAMNKERFERWVAARHAQIEAGELVYIAHQLDYLGEYQPAKTGASMATSRPSA